MRKVVRSQLDTIVALAVVFLIVFIDQTTKNFFSQVLNLGESIPVLRGVFHITLIHNTGIAFGLFKNQGVVFIIIPIIAVALLIYNIYYYQQNEEKIGLSYIVAFSLILGGAIGNLIDRIVFGYVIDFIDLRVWPVFNIADSAITIGALFIGIKCIFLSKRRN